MANALVARAAAHAAWIGDDHGDRYEVAMLAEAVDEELQIVAKEILDHLRAALDYCGREVWSELSGAPSGASVYFPIAREGARASDFGSLMNAKMPGVPAASPAALAAFASVQQFSGPANAWLPELATLSNSAKHDHLSVAAIPEALLHVRQDTDGRNWQTFEPGHGPKRHMPWMALLPRPESVEGHTIYEARYLVFTEVNVELSQYLKEAIAGVGAIVASCGRLLGRS